MVDLQTLILNLRPDLRGVFGATPAESGDNFLAWLITTGSKEYQSVADESGFTASLSETGYGPGGSLTRLQHLILLVRPDVQKAFTLPVQRIAFLHWFYTHGLEECGFWAFLSDAEKHKVLNMPEPWGSRLQAQLIDRLPAQPGRIPLHKRPFGVNLIGYAYGQLGIGEDARMAARALLAAQVPVAMLDFKPGHDIAQNDRSMEQHVKDNGDFAFNVFCLTAEENGRYYAERGRAQFSDRYNIGYWPWELGHWPKDWEMLLELVDEVWVSTRHTYEALAPVCSKPLLVMPMAVELEPVIAPATRPQVRRHYGLPAKARLFCFSFDLNSSLDRKNPQACVDAFLQAFPRKRFGVDDVGLVIKVNKPARTNKAWNKLKEQAAEDARIHIIEGTLQRPDLLALYKACDCFVSLHRAEGFGRGLAEALQLGLHVICTGYSGNVDFCHPPHADLVRYKLVKVRKHQYVHTAGQVWAEPDVKHAAALMRKFVESTPHRKKLKAWPAFSPAVVGERYRLRLEEIRKG